MYFLIPVLRPDSESAIILEMIGDETVNNTAGANDAAASDMFYGVSAAYDISSAATVNLAYGGGSGDADEENIAIGMIYDLGGGVSLRGALASITPNSAADSYMKADFGARFDF